MIVRFLATAGGLALGYGAALMSRCSAVSLIWPPENGLWTCLDSPAPGSYSGTLATAVAGAVAAMLIALAWIPYIVRRRRILINAELSLGENLHRVTEVGVEKTDPSEAPATGGGTPAADGRNQSADSDRAWRDLTVRVEEIENELTSGSMSVGQVTTRWIQLLREANELHNSGEIPTPYFKQVNTRLLELPSMVEPQRVGTSAG